VAPPSREPLHDATLDKTWCLFSASLESAARVPQVRRIRELRKQQGMTELAAELGINQSAVSDYEKGEVGSTPPFRPA
jgi:DNA-binding transcriptional regulator YiaG